MDKELNNILTEGWRNPSFRNQKWNRFGETWYCCLL